MRDIITAKITALQVQLAILNRVPPDTFTFGTTVVFASGPGGKYKWYYVKTGEETWMNFKDGTEKDLARWILAAMESDIGYFEVYVLVVQSTPIFASA